MRLYSFHKRGDPSGNAQVILRFSTVDRPPRATGTTWSSSGLVVEPQMPPDATGHWHLPASRFQTVRLTSAGTCRADSDRTCR